MNPERSHIDKDGLLRRWLVGDADRAEERRLDAAAGDDPFLADALEGYRQMPADDHAAAVTGLKARLRKRTQKEERAGGFYLLRAAAVGAVLLAAWAVFDQFSAKENVAITATEAAKTATEQAPPVLPQATANREDLAANDANDAGDSGMGADFSMKKMPGEPAKNQSSASGATESKRGRDLENEGTAIETKPATASGPIAGATKKTDAPKRAEVPETEEDAAVFDMAADEMVLYQDVPVTESTAPMVQKIVGQVTDDFGGPLTGASVFEEASQAGTVTDANGYFALETDATQPNLRVTYTGYDAEEMSVKDGDFLKIELSESKQLLEEVAVAPMGKKSKPKAAAVQPAGGFEKLEKFIVRNLKKPQAAVDAGVSGVVELRFRIMADGTPGEFGVLKSLGHGCDEEAVRLLLEGPKWEGGHGATVDYSIKF